MFETNRDPFEELRKQWGTAQELSVGSFQKAQERADVQQGIEREEARYQSQREDALSAEARRVALEQMRQLDEALAQLDPDDPEDAQAYEEGVRARNYLTGVLGMSGQNALSAIAEGRVAGDGRLIPVGEAVAAAGARATGAGERRAIQAEEREFRRQRELTVMGFEFQSGESEKQRAFEGMMQEAERMLRQNLTTQQISAQLYEQAVSLGFQGDQAALDRALQKEIESGRIDLEMKRLNATESANLATEYRTAISALDPNVPEDRDALSAILADAESSGMSQGWVSVIRSAVAAQAGRGTQLGFEMTEQQVEDLRAAIENRRAGTALTEAQTKAVAAQAAYTRRQIQSMDVTDAETRIRTNAMEYDLNRKKVTDGRADIIEFQDFIVATASLGQLGVQTLQQMLFDIENGVQDSVYAPYMDFVTPDILELAIEKAQQIGESEDLSREVWLAQARAALIDEDLDNIERIAAYMDPVEIDRMLSAPDDDPMFTGPTGRTMRALRDSLLGNPGLTAAAERKAGLRRVAENQPQIASATARLEFYAAQRPDNIELGVEGVRGALRVLADNGLFGDPVDPEGTNELIEQHVSFYRQAWGDQEGMFNADLAESASRAALNRANASLALRKLTESDAPHGFDLDTLKFIRDTTDRQIDAVKERMLTAGCRITDMMDYQAAAMMRGTQGICEALSMEIKSYEDQYADALGSVGYRNPTERARTSVLESIATAVQADMPDATDAEKQAEVQRRYNRMFTIGEPEPEPEARAPRAPREPVTPAEAGATFGESVREGANAVAGWGTAIGEGATNFARGTGEFIGGFFNRGGNDQEEER
jgi:hypothetical protein